MAQSPEFDERYKIVLIGDSNVGKSKLLLRFTKEEFVQDSRATIGIEFAYKDVKIEGRRIRAQVWDTGGQERYRSIGLVYYRDAVGALLVYDVTSRRSFQNLGRWLQELRAQRGEDVSVLIVGNKVDLSAERMVSVAEVDAFAHANQLRYIETSAKDGSKVEEAFLSIILEAFKMQRPSAEIHSQSSISLAAPVAAPQSRACCD